MRVLKEKTIKYKTLDNPFDNFKSDLARELAVKEFPINYGLKSDKKAFRSLAYVLEESDNSPLFSKYSTEKYISISKNRYSGEDVNVVLDDNSAGNLIYQGPTWKVYSGEEDTFEKTSVTRSELADTILECFTTIGFDYKSVYDELLVEAGEQIERMEEYNSKVKGYLDGSVELPYTMDSIIRKKQRQTVKTNEEKIDIIADLINKDIELPPNINNTEEVAVKYQSYFYGEATPNNRYAPLYWVTQAFTKEEALSKVKRSMYCRKKDTTGIKRDSDWNASSVKLISQVSEEEAKKLVDEPKTRYIA